jgi:hypothetical protein
MFTAQYLAYISLISSKLNQSTDEIPGIEAISTFTFSPSAMNIGNIKSDGLKVVSRTKERIDSLVLNLRPLCNGNILFMILD